MTLPCISKVYLVGGGEPAAVVDDDLWLQLQKSVHLVWKKTTSEQLKPSVFVWRKGET